MNRLDEDLKFIFESSGRTQNLLNIQSKIVYNTLIFDIYYKPKNSFNYLTQSSCQPSQTKNNISLSLAKLIRRQRKLVIEKKGLSKLKKHLIERNNPPEIIHHTFAKCFQPKLDKNKDIYIYIINKINLWTAEPECFQTTVRLVSAVYRL